MSCFLGYTISTRSLLRSAISSMKYVVAELKQCLEPGHLPPEGGNRPLRACGARFVAHKVAALERIIERVGALVSHLSRYM